MPRGGVDDRLAGADEILLGLLVLGHAAHPADGRYVERYWLPTLGPSATCALRRLAPLAEAAGQIGPPVRVPLAALAAELGLGPATGRNATVRRALDRLRRFHLATLAADPLGDRYLLAAHVPSLTQAAVDRLPPHLQERHPHA